MLVYGFKNLFLGKLGDLLFPALISVNFLNRTLIISIKHYEIQLWHSIFVFSFGQPLSKPPLNTSFNSPLLNLLKNKYEKTVVRPDCRISNVSDVVFLYYYEKRLPGSKTYKAQKRHLLIKLFHCSFFKPGQHRVFCLPAVGVMHLTLPANFTKDASNIDLSFRRYNCFEFVFPK